MLYLQPAELQAHKATGTGAGEVNRGTKEGTTETLGLSSGAYFTQTMLFTASTH